jgi:peptidoglycan/LPS O-acetylase OafA/YrhL/protein-S-isoprenylcysteine O-methyltransferase Ste14
MRWSEWRRAALLCRFDRPVSAAIAHLCVRRRIHMLWLRTALFTLLVPGTVLGLVPFALTAGTKGQRIVLGTPHLLGFALLLAGVAIIIWCFIDFVRRGRGTPAPYDPPRKLVVAGLYTYVRNPQYAGVILVAVGEAILSGRIVLFGYAVFLAVGYHLFVRFYEEPTLRRKFGEEYVRYCAAVSRWLPHRSRQSFPVAAGSFHLGYRPALDGVRGLAILMVLSAHTHLLPDTFGFMGVELFFALSGFLITTLLIEEWRENGTVSRRAFYTRRALRLLPALLAMLAIFLGYAAVSGPRRFFRHNLHEALFGLFYCTNWMQVYDEYYFRFLRHTWSLSVEEQFYFLWPAILLWRLRRASLSSTVNLLLLVGILFWAVRAFLFLSTVVNTTQLANALHPESLILGCVAGMILSFGMLASARFTETWLRFGLVAALGGLVWIGFRFNIGDDLMVCIGWMLTSLFSAVIVLGLAALPGTWSRKVFENPVLVYVGKISYGLYLWNSVVLEAIKREFQWPMWEQDLVGTAIIFVAAMASYYLLELPCLRLKRRFSGLAP